MWWILFYVLVFVAGVLYAYWLGYDKGVWQATYMPDLPKVKQSLQESETFWNYY